MPYRHSKRLLQAVVIVLALIPVSAGLAGVVAGPGFVMSGGTAWPAALDSHFRYLSGIFLAVGLVFYATVPGIERKTRIFRLAAALVVCGGLARLVSLLEAGTPVLPHLAGLGMELAVMPLLVLWQGDIARQYAARVERNPAGTPYTD